jgi:hypothetical protein
MMKKLIVLAILLIASQAMALTASWTHDGVNTVGYTLYFWQTSTPSTVYNKSVVGSTIRNIAMSDDYFMPGVEYSFSMSAYNAIGESGHSVPVVKWTRSGTAYTPAADKIPSTLYMKPSGVDTLIIQLTP